jgi:hypothetical protein
MELDVGKPLVVSSSQSSEELSLNNLIWNETISNPGLKVVSSSASLAERFAFGGDYWSFLKSGVKTYLMTSMSPREFFPVFISIVYGYIKLCYFWTILQFHGEYLKLSL